MTCSLGEHLELPVRWAPHAEMFANAKKCIAHYLQHGLADGHAQEEPDAKQVIANPHFECASMELSGPPPQFRVQYCVQ